MGYIEQDGHIHKVYRCWYIYIYNYEGFYEKFAYQMSINREKSQLKVPMQALWEFSHFFGEVL